jgi:hypothetical protein
MEDRLSGVQEVLDGFRRNLDEIHKALNEQKQYDMGVKMDAMRSEMQVQIDRLAKDVAELRGRAAGPGSSGAPGVAPSSAKPS